MRKASFFFVLLISCVSAMAQKTKAYTSGFKAGVNIYKLKVDPETAGISSDTRTNFNAGFFYNVAICSAIHFQPEFLYSSQGGKFKGNKYKSEREISYLSIPLQVQYVTSVGFYAETGPAFSVLAKGKETTSNNGVTSELDLKKTVKKTNISWMGGVGYKMDHIGINARYEYGLVNIAKNDTDPELKSSGIQVSLSWSFNQK